METRTLKPNHCGSSNRENVIVEFTRHSINSEGIYMSCQGISKEFFSKILKSLKECTGIFQSRSKEIGTDWETSISEIALNLQPQWEGYHKNLY